MPTQMPRVEKGVALHDHEISKRAFPGGRMPVKGAVNNAYGDKAWNSIGDGSPSAIAAKAEREDTRAKPALAEKRLAKGK